MIWIDEDSPNVTFVSKFLSTLSKESNHAQDFALFKVGEDKVFVILFPHAFCRNRAIKRFAVLSDLVWTSSRHCYER